MLIRHKMTFNLGGLLALTFVGVLFLIFSPVFGNGKNGLEFSDELFNKLSKGSSYFIPDVSKSVAKWDGKTVSATITLDKADQVEKASKLLMAGGAQVGAQDTKLTINADLGKLLATIVQDSDALYHNNDAEVTARYGFDGRDAMVLWWSVLKKMDKELKKAKQIDESNAVTMVMKKAIEPAYNFFGIPAQQVSEKAGTMTALLIFYVAYTMWWGYAIFYMFDGLGLSMKKAKVKKEV